MAGTSPAMTRMWRASGTQILSSRLSPTHLVGTEDRTMRGVLLWLVGIPIPIIILLYLFNVL